MGVSLEFYVTEYNLKWTFFHIRIELNINNYYNNYIVLEHN